MKKVIKFIVQKFLMLLRLSGLISAEASPQKMRHLELLQYFQEQNLSQNLRILDVGCGTGHFLKILEGQGFKDLHGCDWIHQELPGIQYKKVDLNLEKLAAYQDRSFDIIFCSDVIEHMENPALIFREIQRVLKSDGKAFVTIPNAWNLMERIYFLLTANSTRYRSERKAGPHGHISLFTPRILESLLDRAKLNMESDRAGSGYLWQHRLNGIKSPLWGYNYMMCLTSKNS